MGIGDNIIASGLARGAASRGRRIAFGDGSRIIWDQHSEMIFRDNPNVLRPTAKATDPIQWVPFYKGHRIYNKAGPGRWIWNYDFRCQPGEIFFSAAEKAFSQYLDQDVIIIEPNVPPHKSVAVNKQWPVERFEKVASLLARQGYKVFQFQYGGMRYRLRKAKLLPIPHFRLALSVLSRAALYIGPEGGLHHGAAAVGTKAVVLFGGFIPPQVTGYETHTNLTGGADACGSWNRCQHCLDAMNRISVDEVVAAASRQLPGETC